MAEVKASSAFFFLLIAGAIGFVVLTFFGLCGIGWFNSQWVQEKFKWGTSATLGYTPAKTPNDAIEGFKKAIQKRHYDQAAIYTTSAYGEMLKRAHPACSEIGTTIDKIHQYGKNKGYATDKTTKAFLTLDPFPTHFRIGAAPFEEKGKWYTGLTWDAVEYKNANIAKDSMWDSFDKKMFQNVLGGPTRFFDSGNKIEVIKEGEFWKLNIPTNPSWEGEVTYFTERSKTYNSNLDRFKGDMLNERFTSESYEEQVLQQLRNSKN